MKFYVPIIMLILFLFGACGGKESAEKEEMSENNRIFTSEPSKVAEVEVAELQLSDFSHEVVSNGRVAGRERADLYFSVTDAVITEIFVRNGQRVAKGEKIAALDTYKPQSELAKAQNALAKVELELKDALIGQGYDPDNLSGVPPEVMRLARLRSGYDEAEATVSFCRRQLDDAVLTAPFSGTVANLSAKAFNRPDGSKPLCTIIGDGMDVEFKILEGELAVVTPRDRVEITLYSSSEKYEGRVSDINPQVDSDGLVRVQAMVDRPKGLYDGMNVKVSVHKSLGRQLVVPKSAVVLRTGRQVVFTLSDDGKKAMWNYVQTGLENMESYSIVDGLEPGMKVIVSGNMNLAHESPVTVRKK